MQPVVRKCTVCGATYEANPTRLRHGRQTTCGRECSYQLRSATLSKFVVLTCSVCGTQFERVPSQIKSKHEGVYCSRECHYAGRSLGLTKRIVTAPYIMVAEYDRKAAIRKAWETRRRLGKDHHSETTRERLRQKTIAYISRIAPAHIVSKIEEVVAKELIRIGVPFQRQTAIRNNRTGRYVACADFLLDDAVVLEVNGTFWHADPRAYPNGPIYPSQVRTLLAYERKRSALVALGIPLIEVWEADLAESPENAVRHALRTTKWR